MVSLDERIKADLRAMERRLLELAKRPRTDAPRGGAALMRHHRLVGQTQILRCDLAAVMKASFDAVTRGDRAAAEQHSARFSRISMSLDRVFEQLGEQSSVGSPHELLAA